MRARIRGFLRRGNFLAWCRQSCRFPRGLRAGSIDQRRAIVRAGAIGSAATSIACSLALNFNGIDDGVRDGAASDVTIPGDGGADGTNASDATVDGPITPVDATALDGTVAPVDGASDAADGGDAKVTPPSDAACPATLPGPVMVATTPGACIDSTEVTVAQFTTYVAAKGSSTPSGQPSVCSWNTTILPFGWPPSGNTDLPVANVNWCQAYLYCQWAGKHLCGAPAGGAGNPNGWADPAQSAWYAACSHDGIQPYPYGDTYSASTCNGADYGAGQTRSAVASCVGAYPGAFDLSGNVYEWEDACMAADGGTTLGGVSDYCAVRGGAYNADASALRCDDGEQASRESQADFLGFRCCSP